MEIKSANNKRLALPILVGIGIAALILHLLILFKVIPYSITWGGRLKSDSQMYLFETISILINAFFVFVLLQKGNRMKPLLSPKTVTIILWIFFGVFSLNTIGNIFAKTTFERGFTLVTLGNAVLLWMVNKQSR